MLCLLCSSSLVEQMDPPHSSSSGITYRTCCVTLRSDIQSPASWDGQAHLDFCETLEITEAKELTESFAFCLFFLHLEV